MNIIENGFAAFFCLFNTYSHTQSTSNGISIIKFLSYQYLCKRLQLIIEIRLSRMRRERNTFNVRIANWIQTEMWVKWGEGRKGESQSWISLKFEYFEFFSSVKLLQMHSCWPRTNRLRHSVRNIWPEQIAHVSQSAKEELRIKGLPTVGGRGCCMGLVLGVCWLCWKREH